MRGTVRGINARRWVICEAGMCEAQRTTGATGVVGCEPLSSKLWLIFNIFKTPSRS